MAPGEYVELLRLEKRKEADTTMELRGRSAADPKMTENKQPFDAVDLTRRIAERERAKPDSGTVRYTDASRASKDSGYKTNSATVPSIDPGRTTKDSGYKTDSSTAPYTDPSRTTKDSSYELYDSGSVVQEEAVEEQEEAFDLKSIRTLSSFVDLGLDGRLRGINIFASHLALSLSPDISEIVEGRELVVVAVQDALRAYSYSLEQQNRPSKLSDERKAAHFVRQQSQ